MNFIKIVENFLKKEHKYRTLANMNPKKYKSFLEKEYLERTGEEPNLDHTQKYTEKMQYAKVHLSTPLKTKLSDKYEVREWVTEKIGSEYLIPLLGVWDNVNDINFDELPEKFVLKINGGSGTNIIVEDKAKLNYLKTKLKLRYWMNRNFAFDGDIQLHYKDIIPKIIAEDFISDSSGELKEYKFFCFNGKVYYCWLISTHDGERYGNIYDKDWNLQEFYFQGRPNSPFKQNPPKNYQELIAIAEKLSEGFSQVRVDLYNVDEKIYFGEMTFTSSGGYRLIFPEEYNYKLGDLWSMD